MIDVGRFMQDGVGAKKTQYEQSILNGAGSFTANGKIVFVVGVSRISSGNNVGQMFGSKYIFPSSSTSTINWVSYNSWDGVNITYVDALNITYSLSQTNSLIVISEKA